MDLNVKLENKLPEVLDIELVAIEGLEKMREHFGVSDDLIIESQPTGTKISMLKKLI
ncbi:MAG: hypothetical protein ACW98D_19895 [Promethearchaeota archaeon]|jgi:hypothetical protein